ncbi:NeuD/PglB/VioB family sugar acetyltransferase [Neobacillus terrae]|uniref:NeuD/PglB/VioB family sugar acetyltransferase n=1 Tax=Neobacillus terrae TaxID=3034837 RepID=UPI00140D1A00|nr:acetyltransferase [Neobacillus terrae]
MNIVVIGHGGHSKVISDIILANKGFQIYGYLDYKYQRTEKINNFLCGPVSAAKLFIEDYTDVKFLIAIGDNKVRKTIVEELAFPIEQYATLVHPLASISLSAKIGHGTVVMPNSVINADAVIGNHCIINSCAVVEHDSVLEDFVHLCPNSTITGTVEIGEGTCVGSGATIIPNNRIGEWTTIGAGATVVNNIPGNCIAIGTPARVKLNKKVNMG